MTDPTTNLLIRARSFLERGWCRGALALDANGNKIAPKSPDAVAWDAIGAVLAAEFQVTSASYLIPAAARLRAAIGGEDFDTFNNSQETVEPVLAVFDRAIAGEPPPSADERPKDEPAARSAGREG